MSEQIEKILLKCVENNLLIKFGEKISQNSYPYVFSEQEEVLSCLKENDLPKPYIEVVDIIPYSEFVRNIDLRELVQYKYWVNIEIDKSDSHAFGGMHHYADPDSRMRCDAHMWAESTFSKINENLDKFIIVIELPTEKYSMACLKQALKFISVEFDKEETNMYVYVRENGDIETAVNLLSYFSLIYNPYVKRPYMDALDDWKGDPSEDLIVEYSTARILCLV